MTIITAIWLYFYGYKHIPVRHSEETTVFNQEEKGKKQVPKWQEIASVLAILGVFFAMAFQKQIGMPLYEISFLGAVAVCALRLVKGKEFYSLIDLKTVFLYAGMMPLGQAMKTTGAAQLIADGVAVIVGNSHSGFLIISIVFLVTCTMTQFTSNVVTINLLVPILTAIGSTLGISAVPLIVAAAAGASCGYISPVSCPPATIIYGSGGFRFTDYVKSNWALLLITYVVCVVLLPIIWPV